MKSRRSAHHETEEIRSVVLLQVLKQSIVSFVHLVAKHEKKSLLFFNKPLASQMCEDDKVMVQAVATDFALRGRLEKDASRELGKAWSGAGCRFEELLTFIPGTSTMKTKTSRVDGDFSLVNHRRDEHCAALTVYSLEEMKHAKQYQPDLNAARSLYLHEVIGFFVYWFVNNFWLISNGFCRVPSFFAQIGASKVLS